MSTSPCRIDLDGFVEWSPIHRLAEDALFRRPRRRSKRIILCLGFAELLGDLAFATVCVVDCGLHGSGDGAELSAKLAASRFVRRKHGQGPGRVARVGHAASGSANQSGMTEKLNWEPHTLPIEAEAIVSLCRGAIVSSRAGPSAIHAAARADCRLKFAVDQMRVEVFILNLLLAAVRLVLAICFAMAALHRGVCVSARIFPLHQSLHDNKRTARV